MLATSKVATCTDTMIKHFRITELMHTYIHKCTLYTYVFVAPMKHLCYLPSQQHLYLYLGTLASWHSSVLPAPFGYLLYTGTCV